MILQPNLVNNFQVRFLDLDGYELKSTKELETQVVSVRGIVETDSKVVYKPFAIVFQDDVTNAASLGVTHLQQLPFFVVELQQLDAQNNLVRYTTLSGVKVVSAQYSDLDYTKTTSSEITLLCSFLNIHRQYIV